MKKINISSGEICVSSTTKPRVRPCTTALTRKKYLLLQKQKEERLRRQQTSTPEVMQDNETTPGVLASLIRSIFMPK